MPTDQVRTIVGISVTLLIVGGCLFMAYKASKHQKRVKDLLTRSEEMQNRLFDRTEQLQIKEAELQLRWEAILKRLETLANRMEIRN